MNHGPMLIGAGFLAGAMNALAGGGSFVSLPALIAAGVPSVAANASSTVALFPGGGLSAWVYRGRLAAVCGVAPRLMLAWTLAGGLTGALLLIWTPSRVFDRILPWLLLITTVVLALGPRLGPALRARWRPHRAGVVGVQFLLGIYGGYFGGAVGLMMIAAWSLLGGDDIRALNGPRTAMVTAANAVAVACFVIAGTVWWPQTLMLGLGALAGGYAGARLGRRLPSTVVRGVTLVAASVITAVFFARAFWR